MAVRYDHSPLVLASPVIEPGGSGSDYESQIFDPALYCVKPGDSSKRLLFLSVMKSPVATGLQQAGVWQIDPAQLYSSAGYTYLGLAIPAGGEGAWDQGGVRLGTGFIHSGTIYLYYTGGSAGGGTSIGVATSTTGVQSSFTRHASNPILTPDGQGRDDGDNVSEPCILTDGPGGAPLQVSSNYWMMYSYRNGGTVLPAFRLATSTDLIEWDKYTDSTDVLIPRNTYGEWHQWYYENGMYHVIYESGGTTSSTTPYRIYYASSKNVHGPYVTSFLPFMTESNDSSRWDRYHVATAARYVESGTDIVFYCACNDMLQPYYENTWALGVAKMSTAPFFSGSRA